MLMAEGGLMALCLVPAWHFADGTLGPIAICSAFTLAVGCLLWYRHQRYTQIEDRRMSYLLVVLLWLPPSTWTPAAHTPGRPSSRSCLTRANATSRPFSTPSRIILCKE